MDDAHTQPRRLNLPERIELARALKRHGLGMVRLPGLTTDTPPCMGKANGCHHACCVTTPEPVPDAVIQPWEARAPRRAIRAA